MFLKVMEMLRTHYAQELPFVVYRRPNGQEVMAILQNNDQLHAITDFSESGFIFAPFDDETEAILIKADERVVANDFTSDVPVETADVPLPAKNTGKAFHLKLVQKGISEIASGSLRKVVLSRQETTYCEAALFRYFTALLSKYPTAFCYLWYHPKVGIWLGATPEFLLRTENDHMTTMSLAGTRKFVLGETPLWGHKELEEQLMVTEYIKTALENKVAGIKLFGPESIRAGGLWHLRTKITGRMNQNLPEIIKALHPTPAVCGIPLVESKRFILDNEDYPREYYTGYLGELNMRSERNRTTANRNQENRAYRTIKTTTELYVNLRCMQLRDGKALTYIGGGITAGSDPEQEWEETVNKSDTILRVLYGA